jgi:hypothetical protein
VPGGNVAYAVTGNYADVVTAISTVTGQANAKVIIPAGNWTWTNELVIGWTNGFTLAGASSNSRPVIGFNHGQTYGLYAAGVSNHAVTIQDLIFTNSGTAPTAAMMAVAGSGVCFHVTDCEFDAVSQGKFGIQVGPLVDSTYVPGPYGLIDNCQFHLNYADTINWVNVSHNGSYGSGGFYYSWTLPMSWGSTNNCVIENCGFYTPGSPVGAMAEGAAAHGSSCVIASRPTSRSSTHGNQVGSKQGTLEVEFYANTMYETDTVNGTPYLYFNRGGSSLVYSNTAIQTAASCTTRCTTLWTNALPPQIGLPKAAHANCFIPPITLRFSKSGRVHRAL